MTDEIAKSSRCHWVVCKLFTCWFIYVFRWWVLTATSRFADPSPQKFKNFEHRRFLSLWPCLCGRLPSSSPSLWSYIRWNEEHCPVVTASEHKKSNLHYIRGITPKRANSDGAHLRGLHRDNTASKETLQRSAVDSRWRYCLIWPARESNPRPPTPIPLSLPQRQLAGDMKHFLRQIISLALKQTINLKQRQQFCDYEPLYFLKPCFCSRGLKLCEMYFFCRKIKTVTSNRNRAWRKILKSF